MNILTLKRNEDLSKLFSKYFRHCSKLMLFDLFVEFSNVGKKTVLSHSNNWSVELNNFSLAGNKYLQAAFGENICVPFSNSKIGNLFVGDDTSKIK